MIEVKRTPGFAIAMLDSYKRYLSTQEYKTMKGQIDAGAPEAALKGLKRLLRKRGVLNENDDL